MAGVRHTVSLKQRNHILNGDASGGGHRAGNPGPKSKFPSTWTDDDIIRAVEAVANDPKSEHLPGKGDRILLRGRWNSVTIRVISSPDGYIITGYPEKR